jgi:hypothetical protein
MPIVLLLSVWFSHRVSLTFAQAGFGTQSYNLWFPRNWDHRRVTLCLLSLIPGRCSIKGMCPNQDTFGSKRNEISSFAETTGANWNVGSTNFYLWNGNNFSSGHLPMILNSIPFLISRIFVLVYKKLVFFLKPLITKANRLYFLKQH